MRRRVALFLICGFVLPLVVAASASAQGSTLQVDDQTPAPGQVITLTGTNFSAAAGNSPVNVRLSTRDGEVLSSPTPNSLGQISATFPVPPSLQPGWYLLLATQTTTANGRQRAFTPGRVRIRVTGPSGASAAPPRGGGGGSSGLPLVLGAGALVLVLLAGGATLVTRRERAVKRPELTS